MLGVGRFSASRSVRLRNVRPDTGLRSRIPPDIVASRRDDAGQVGEAERRVSPALGAVRVELRRSLEQGEPRLRKMPVLAALSQTAPRRYGELYAISVRKKP